MKLGQSKWSKKEESKMCWVEKDDARAAGMVQFLQGLIDHCEELVWVLP